jgi:hypothetical protein
MKGFNLVWAQMMGKPAASREKSGKKYQPVEVTANMAVHQKQ